MRHNVFSMLAACALMLGSCTSEVEELAPTNHDDSQTMHTATLVFDGSIDHFDAQTRAVTSDWEDGAAIYIQYTTTRGTEVGRATYSQSKGEWTVNYGDIRSGEQGKCEVYYFENPKAASWPSSVTLSEQSAVFADNDGSFALESGVMKITAHMKPLTGRIRFKGTSGQEVTFEGVKSYTSYSITSNTLTASSGSMTLTVASSGYTPYVYAVFTDATNPQLTIESDNEDYSFQKSFDSSVLAAGKSGYLNIPTMDMYNGWKLVNNSPEKAITVSGNGKTVSFKMIKVKPGTFQMGSTSGYSDEEPVHSVTLTKAYYMCETEVTQGLWYAVMGQSPTSSGSSWSSGYGLGDKYPAYYISYEDCQQFLTKLNQMTGQQFRFPTEAEWEFAARGGTKSGGYTYSGSNTVDDVAWYSSNSGSKTHEVGTKKANELGLYDMSGNVWEWCADWYGSYSSSAQTNPTGPTTGSDRVIRGGGWLNFASSCRVANRNLYAPSYRNSDLGFRLAL